VTVAADFVSSPRGRRPGNAWIGLYLAVALHVCDEAATGFLDIYNPAVLSMKQQLPWLPLPTFSFETWIVGLAFGSIVLGSVLPGAYSSPVLLVVAGWACLCTLNHWSEPRCPQ
jgi:hypothetical protein